MPAYWDKRKRSEKRYAAGGDTFSPDLVQCFRELAVQESFWLDFASSRIYRVLLDMIAWPRVELKLDELEQIVMIFSHIVDFRSPFTATHSAGVATVARELAKRMHFSEKDCRLMHVAGFLHDLGKVAVPNSILDKSEKLDPGEFDVIRAHTYYTYQILSTIVGFEDIASWAAFHHERLDGKGTRSTSTGASSPWVPGSCAWRMYSPPLPKTAPIAAARSAMKPCRSFSIS